MIIRLIQTGGNFLLMLLDPLMSLCTCTFVYHAKNSNKVSNGSGGGTAILYSVKFSYKNPVAGGRVINALDCKREVSHFNLTPHLCWNMHVEKSDICWFLNWSLHFFIKTSEYEKIGEVHVSGGHILILKLKGCVRRWTGLTWFTQNDYSMPI